LLPDQHPKGVSRISGQPNSAVVVRDIGGPRNFRIDGEGASLEEVDRVAGNPRYRCNCRRSRRLAGGRGMCIGKRGKRGKDLRRGKLRINELPSRIHRKCRLHALVDIVRHAHDQGQLVDALERPVARQIVITYRPVLVGLGAIDTFERIALAPI
jgi:hypothetical protein